MKRGAPEYDFATAGRGRRTSSGWCRRAAGARLEALFRAVPALYVADGHHRTAAASRVHADARGRPASTTPSSPSCSRTTRCRSSRTTGSSAIRAAASPEALLERAPEGRSTWSPATRRRAPDHPRAFGIYLGGRWWHAHVRPGSFDASDPVASLDCSIAQDQMLAPLFGIADPRTSRTSTSWAASAAHAELERRVGEEGWSLALHLYPTRIEQLIAVTDAGLLMPPKSTWFEPKLRSGLFVHPF